MFVNTVPTEATRRGDFSDYRDRNGNLILIYDPLTTRPNPNGSGVIRDPFPGNIIPADRLDPVGLNVASIYPLPNGPGQLRQLHLDRRTARCATTRFTGRIDHRAGDRDSFFVRFSYEKYKLDAPQGQAACCLPTPAEAAARFDLGPFVAGIQNTRLTTHGRGRSTGRTCSARPSSTSCALGFAKTNPETRQSDYGHQAATSLGIQGINVNEYTTGLPEPQHPGRHRHLGRPGLPAGQPEADPLPGRGHAVVGEGPALAQDAATASSCASPRRSPTPTRAAASRSTAT